MTGNKPIVSAFCSVVPGLGQVYCGRNLRGILILLGALLTGVLALLMIFSGFGKLLLFDPDILLIPLAVWVFGAYDAYVLAMKMETGEIPAHEPQMLVMVLFVIGAIILAGILFAILSFAFVVLAFSSGQNYQQMHASPEKEVTFTATKSGTVITITNTNGGESGLTGYDITVNGKHAEVKAGTEKGAQVQVNGTTGPDRIIVAGYWTYGAKQVFLDTVL